jgi:hypothetical protein
MIKAIHATKIQESQMHHNYLCRCPNSLGSPNLVTAAADGDHLNYVLEEARIL